MRGVRGKFYSSVAEAATPVLASATLLINMTDQHCKVIESFLPSTPANRSNDPKDVLYAGYGGNDNRDFLNIYSKNPQAQQAASILSMGGTGCPHLFGYWLFDKF
jgi:hypothetical protein